MLKDNFVSSLNHHQQLTAELKERRFGENARKDEAIILQIEFEFRERTILNVF